MTTQAMRMRVEGMTCESCERHVARALESAGAKEATANFRSGEARFVTESGVATGQLAGAVAAVGYRPGPIEPLQAQDTLARNERGGGHDPYDLAIVGSGGAAFAAAIQATELGARVVMIERGTLGGTCVNIGCVPSKTLLRAGELYYQAGHQPFSGIGTRADGLDLPALVAQKDQLISQLRREKYEDLIAAYGWDLVRGEARFRDALALEVNGETLRAARVLIATGAGPAVPPIPGLADVDYLTSTSALSLRRLPQRLIVIGSGYVALELGQLFRHLGSEVTLLQRSPRLLKEYEPELAAAVHEVLSGQGMHFLTAVRYERVEQRAGTYRVDITVGEERRVVEGDALLVAAGRAPHTAALALEKAGVAVDARGAVVIDEHLRTTNPRVFAAGDVTLGPQFVYVAAYEGRLAAANALTDAPQAVDLRFVPGVVFTTPSIATVGLTEAQAQAAGREVKSAVLPLKAVPRAIVNREAHGLFKLVADARTDRLLGAHVLAENAGDVIYAATLAVQFNLTVTDLVRTFAPYLTMAEGLKLAAQTFGRDVAKLSCCAG